MSTIIQPTKVIVKFPGPQGPAGSGGGGGGGGGPDVTISTQGANAGLSMASGQVLSLQFATDSQAGAMTAADHTILSGATATNSANKIVERDGSGNFSVSGISMPLGVSNGLTIGDVYLFQQVSGTLRLGGVGQNFSIGGQFNGSGAGLINIPSSSVVGLGSAALLNADNSANNLPKLDGSGQLPSSVLPPLSISNVFVVASQAAMLALTAQEGDVAIRTDITASFILSNSVPSVLGNWKEILATGVGGGVATWNGLSGTVSVTTSDLPEGTNLYYTAGRVAAAAPNVTVDATGITNGLSVAAGQIMSLANIPLAALSATGTKNSTTTLRGDNTWATFVSSVGLSLPSEFSVSGSPVTTSGTLSATWGTQTTNKVFAAPNGSTGIPSFRLLVAADIPTTLNGMTFTGTTICPTPSGITEVANKGYVDAIASGLDSKASVRVASTANVSVTYTATGGTSARGQITAAPSTLDGISLAVGNRILLWQQTTAAQNGLWVVTTVGSGANGVWDRATDFDQDAEVTAGAYCFVEEGTTYAECGFTLITDNPIIIGGASGTSLTWTQFSQSGVVVGANLGSGGVNVFSSKTGVSLNFRQIKVGSSKITVTQNTNDITLDVGPLAESDITGLVADLALKAPLANAALTGTTTAQTIAATKAVTSGLVALTFGSTINTDASLGNTFVVLMTGPATLAAPTNSTNGQKVTWKFIQDATGGRTLALNSIFYVPGGLTLALSTPANAIDSLTAEFDTGTLKWVVTSFTGRSSASATIVSSATGTQTAIDCSLTNSVKYNMTGNITLPAPTGMADQQLLVTRFAQDATGSRTVTLNAAFRIPGGQTFKVSTTASTVDTAIWQYDLTDTKWDLIAFENEITSKVWASGSANRFLATPNGSSGVPIMRAIAIADIATGTPDGTKFVRDDGTLASVSGASGGTVTSVGLTLPAEFSVTGTPVTGSGVLAGAWVNQTTNKVLAAPNGSTGVPTFRALVAADIPTTLSGITFTGTTVVPTPSGGTEAANKSYVDGVAQGFQIKPTATLATTAALPANTYLAGVLTATGNGALTVDSVAVQNGDLILVKDEATGANKGLYGATDKGSAGTPYILTRHTSMDASAECAGALVPVGSAGTVNGNSLWLCNPSGAVTLGTTALPFTELNKAADLIAGTNISFSGNTVNQINNPTHSGLLTANAGVSTTKLTASAAVQKGTVSVSFASSVTPNSDNCNNYEIGTLTGIITVNAPSGTPVNGQELVLCFTQNGTGFAVTLDTGTNGFAYGSDIGSGDLPTTPSKSFYVGCKWHSGTSKWRVVSLIKGF